MVRGYLVWEHTEPLCKVRVVRIRIRVRVRVRVRAP